MKPKLDIVSPSKGIEEKLDIQTLDPLDVEADDVIFNDNVDDDTKDDYRFVRTKLRHAILAGEAILNASLTQVRYDSNPRVIEGCSTILKTIIDSTEKLVDIHGKLKKISMQKAPDAIPTTQKDGDGKPKSVSASIGEIMDAVDDDDLDD